MSLDTVVDLFPAFVAGFTDPQFLAIGGLAYVYMATGLGYRFPVALKILKPEFRKNLFALARFERETELHKLFDHPNIVKFYELRHAFASCPAIVMELVGRTLKDLVGPHKPLPWPRTCKLGRQLAFAIADVHKKDILALSARRDRTYWVPGAPVVGSKGNWSTKSIFTSRLGALGWDDFHGVCSYQAPGLSMGRQVRGSPCAADFPL